VIWQLIRRRWFAAAGSLVAAVALYAVYYSVDEVPSQLTTYAPHLVTLIVLAAASQRLRMPAADGVVYRRG